MTGIYNAIDAATDNYWPVATATKASATLDVTGWQLVYCEADGDISMGSFQMEMFDDMVAFCNANASASTEEKAICATAEDNFDGWANGMSWDMLYEATADFTMVGVCVDDDTHTCAIKTLDYIPSGVFGVMGKYYTAIGTSQLNPGTGNEFTAFSDSYPLLNDISSITAEANWGFGDWFTQGTLDERDSAGLATDMIDQFFWKFVPIAQETYLLEEAKARVLYITEADTMKNYEALVNGSTGVAATVMATAAVLLATL